MNKELIIAFSIYGIGGAQRRAFNLAHQFAQNGYTVYILAVWGTDSTIKDENYYHLNDKINIVIVPEFYKKNKNRNTVVKSDRIIHRKISTLKKIQYIAKPFKKLLHKISYKLKCYRECIDTRSFLLQHKNSTIICFGFNIFDRIYYAAKGLKCKIIYAETNSSDKYSRDRFFAYTSKSIKKSDALVFQTNEEKAEHQISESKKAYVIHNPIKTNLPQPYEGIRNKTIVNFCRLSPQKNLMLLVQAFEKLHYEFPDYKLELYADTGASNISKEKKELVSYIQSKNLEDCIFLLPPSSDIHNIVLKSAMFVSSSDYEGISNSMIEAMAIGLPCVCTDCGGGGAREMITDGESGLLVPVGNADALKNAMARMITEDGLAEKCSKNAAKIRKTHSIERISEKWLEVIDNI